MHGKEKADTPLWNLKKDILENVNFLGVFGGH